MGIVKASDRQSPTQRKRKMTIKITVVNPVNGNEVFSTVFNNSIDAAAERKVLDAAGCEYKVEWNCK
jgi:hypothetical protein